MQNSVIFKKFGYNKNLQEKTICKKHFPGLLLFEHTYPVVRGVTSYPKGPLHVISAPIATHKLTRKQ